MLKGCETGKVKHTRAYHLPSKFIFHTVGPVWKGGQFNETELLASCYRECLTLALKLKCKSIAFPSISTGVYGFPKKKAANIALREVIQFIKIYSAAIEIYFICFDKANFQIYNEKLAHFHH